MKFHNNDGYACRLHSHPEVSLGYIKSSCTTITVQGQKYRLLPGDFVLIPSETTHLCLPEDEQSFQFIMLYMKASWWESGLPSPASSFMTLAAPADPLMRQFFNQQSREDQNFAPEALLFHLKRICKLLIRNNSDEKDPPDKITRLHEMIQNKPAVSMSIQEYAARLEMSPYTLIRNYARRYGLTPHADKVNMMVQRAILMFESDRSLTEIALDCGFSDQSHFIRQFKRYCGLRPQDYRSAILSNSI